MGKKDKKNKNKISGQVKTALKTEKKLNAKQKKELAALGEVRFVSLFLSSCVREVQVLKKLSVLKKISKSFSSEFIIKAPFIS